ncbi:MAG: glycine betaine ABC transporter substrate-binding protein, partial [Acidimicrobiales bacterium]
QSMADHLEANADATLCLETEFPNRPDGLVLFEEATGYTVPESQIDILETGVIYEETVNGNCQFGEIFTTDGRIPALNLNVVDDPGVFIIYNVSLTMPDTVYQQAPEAWDAVVGAILAPLDADTMAELNRRVSAGGEDAADVANDFLTTNGII